METPIARPTWMIVPADRARRRVMLRIPSRALWGSVTRRNNRSDLPGDDRPPEVSSPSRTEIRAALRSAGAAAAALPISPIAKLITSTGTEIPQHSDGPSRRDLHVDRRVRR